MSTSMIGIKEFQLYERRIDNCFATRDKFVEGTWGYDFWQRTAMALLRQLNRNMSQYK